MYFWALLCIVRSAGAKRGGQTVAHSIKAVNGKDWFPKFWTQVVYRLSLVNKFDVLVRLLVMPGYRIFLIAKILVFISRWLLSFNGSRIQCFVIKVTLAVTGTHKLPFKLNLKIFLLTNRSKIENLSGTWPVS